MKPVISNRSINPPPPTSIQRPKPVVNVARQQADRFNEQLRIINANMPKVGNPEEIQRVKVKENRNLPVQDAVPAPVGERRRKRNLESKKKRGKGQS